MKTKRFLSILLSLVLVLGMLPVMSLTAFADGNTTTITPGSDDAKTGTGTMTITLKIKAAQTITADNVTASYGDTDKSVSASVTTPSTGGGTISYAVKEGSGDYISVASDGKLTIKAVPPTDGKAYVIVTAAATDDYAETTKEVTVTISKAEATVTALNQSIMVGGTVPDLSAPVLDTHYSVTGLVGEDTLTTAPTLAYQKNGSAATPDSATAGTYDIVPSGASAGDNYNISYTNGTLTITAKDTQTITASDVTATYGDTDKSVSASTDGNGEISYTVKAGSENYIDVNTSTGALTIKAVPADGKAYVTVTAAETTTGGTGGNGYAAATKDVTVNIRKATVTITAKDQSIYVGGTVPTLSGADFYTVTGLVGEETLTTNPTLVYQKNGSAVTPDNTTAGTYDIVLSGASAGDNYNISYTNGTLTISSKGTQTITAENVTATYGDTDKSVSATVTDPATGGGAISYAVKEGSGDYIEVNASTGALTIKKVGTATVIVTAAETATYAQATREVTVTINKANAVAATVTANNRTYDGTEKPLVTVEGEPTGGTMQYALGTETEATEPYTTSIPTKTNAGTYYVWYKVAGDANHNDSMSDTPVTVQIGKATNIVTVSLTGWTYGDTANTPTATATYGADGATFTYSTGADGTYVSEKPTNAGTYYVKAAIVESTNYSSGVSEPVSFTIAPKALTDAMLTLTDQEYEHNGDEKTPTITVKDGTTTLVQGTDYTVDSTSKTSSAAYGTYTIKVNGKGNYTASATQEWKITDHTNPTAEIKIETNSFKTFLNTISFGWFFNKTETVTITTEDAGSGVAKIEYLTSSEIATTREAVDALAGTWTTVTNKTSTSFAKDPEAKFIVYTKVTDKAGNVTYVTSEGVVLDTTAPVITVDGGVPAAVYHKAVVWAATDDHLKDVVITFTAEDATTGTEIYNGATTGEQTRLESTDVLSGLGSYTIKATDKAGNPKEVTFAITGRDAAITGKADSITYEADKTYDLSRLFTVEDGVTVSTYEIVANADTNAEAGAGTITGGTLTVTRAGLITVKATVAKGQTVATTPEYINKTTAEGTLTVGRAAGNAGITINDVVYGNQFTVLLDSTNAGVTPETKYTMTADAAGNEIPAASQTESTEKPVNVGTYKAVVTYPASGLYNAVSEETTFKITPAKLTVTAEAKEKTYGGADPALTYTVAGLAYEDTEDAVLTGALTRTAGENAGIYAIGQGTLAANGNYTISYTGANLTIGKAEMADKTVADTVEVISAGVTDETIDLKEYLEDGAALVSAEASGELAGYISAGALNGGIFAYSVAENNGGINGTLTLTVSSTNYKDYTIRINLASAKKITEVVVETKDVAETAVEAVEVPALEDFTEAQPEATVEVKMEVKLESEATVEQEIGTVILNKIKDTIAKAFGGVASTELKQEYLDVTITKSVNGGAPQEISDVNRVLEIAVNYDLTGKYNPVVTREHEGTVTQFTRLNSRPAAGSYKDGTYYVEGSGKNAKIYIYGRWFSVYTVAYTTTASYQVTFDDAAGDEKQDSNVTQVVVATGTKVGKPADPERDGYDFDGWYVNGTNTKWNFDTAVTGDITLVAHWDEEDDDDDEVVATPAPVVTAAPRSPKTNDGLMSYSFWLILAAAGLAVSGMAAKGRKKEQ